MTLLNSINLEHNVYSQNETAHIEALGKIKPIIKDMIKGTLSSCCFLWTLKTGPGFAESAL